MIVFLAGFLAGRAQASSASSGRCSARSALVAVPVLLVFFEPDFGTALVYCAALVGVLFFARRPLAATSPRSALRPRARRGRRAVVLPSRGRIEVLKPYQVDRLIGFVDPDADPSGTTYNVEPGDHGGRRGRARRARRRPGRRRRSSTTSPSTPPTSSSPRSPSSGASSGQPILLLLYAIVVWRGIKVVAVADSLFTAAVAGAIVAALAVPGLPQRRDEHRHRADHRHPAPVRQLRRQLA